MKNKKVATLIGALVAAATVLFLIKKNRRYTKETPSSKAPQLPIDNPGEQSNFPASPSGDKELG